MLKHVTVLMTFAVLAVGCAKLPFSTVDSSEPTPVTDDGIFHLNSYRELEPEMQQSPQTEITAPALPEFLIPENSPATQVSPTSPGFPVIASPCCVSRTTPSELDRLIQQPRDPNHNSSANSH